MRISLRALFSELEEAIPLSQALMEEVLPQRRSAPVVVPPVSTQGPATAAFPSLDLSSVGTFGVRIWDVILDWSRQATGASTAFLVDMDGLVVATRGPLSPETVEFLSPGLLTAQEQMLQMFQPFGDFQFLSVQFGEDHLCFLSLNLPGNLPLALGLVGPPTVDVALRKNIEAALIGALGS
ncbi:MAG: hypothetical protein LWX11_06500 [Firmicutes bacterium]|nr:hypothetical protein [Bacillota bacterium]